MNHNQAKKILGVESSATPEDIKKAYRKLAMQHHPDRNQGDKKSEEEFKRIKEAFDVLQIPEEDNIVFRYTNSGQRHPDGNTYTSINNVVFPITIKEAFFGITKTVTLPGGLSAISISIPPGVGEEDCVKIVEFEKCIYRVYVKISEPAAQIDWGRFELHKRGDVTIARSVCPFTMMIGGFHEVSTIDGSTVQVRIPRGLEANKLLKVRGKGYWRNKKCLERGDLFIRAVPTIQKIEDIAPEKIEKFLNEYNSVKQQKNT